MCSRARTLTPQPRTRARKLRRMDPEERNKLIAARDSLLKQMKSGGGESGSNSTAVDGNGGSESAPGLGQFFFVFFFVF